MEKMDLKLFPFKIKCENEWEEERNNQSELKNKREKKRIKKK